MELPGPVCSAVIAVLCLWCQQELSQSQGHSQGSAPCEPLGVGRDVLGMGTLVSVGLHSPRLGSHRVRPSWCPAARF